MFKLVFIKLRDNLRNVISVALVFSCFYNYTSSMHFMCMLYQCLNATTPTMVAMFPRAVAMACIISRITDMYKSIISANCKYEKKIDDYEVYYPQDVCEVHCRRVLIIVFVILAVVIILPINSYRIYLLYYHFEDRGIVVFFSLMYIQNASMYMTEVQFIHHCFVLYQKFQSINEDMSVFRSNTIIVNGYPSVLKSKYKCDKNHIGSGYDDGFPRGIRERSTLVKSIELLKMRHQFISNTVRELNELYGIQLGSSLCVLFIMTLFDLYEVLIREFNIAKTSVLLYGWLLQYAFRFCAIIFTTYVTAKQVVIIIVVVII